MVALIINGTENFFNNDTNIFGYFNIILYLLSSTIYDAHLC